MREKLAKAKTSTVKEWRLPRTATTADDLLLATREHLSAKGVRYAKVSILEISLAGATQADTTDPPLPSHSHI